MKKYNIKGIVSLLLILVMVFSMAACGSNTNEGGGSSQPANSNGAGETEPKEIKLTASLGFEPETLDPAFNTAVDGASMIVHLFSGLAKWDQDENGALKVVPDLAQELVEGVSNDNGTVTYTYTLKDGVKWSDGKPVTAQDFVYAWQRASNTSTGADFQYMFQVIDGYSEADPEAKLNAKAVDEKTIEITLAAPVSYWNELLAFPTYFPVREDVVEDPLWATEPLSLIGNGPYKMTGWAHNSMITLEKNPNYHDPDSVTMEKIEFYLTDDAGNMVSNFRTGSWKIIDDVPANEISTLKVEYPDEFQVKGQIGTYAICWNVNKEILPANTQLKGEEAETAREEIRKALSLLIDRNYIVNEIGQAGQVPASSFVAMGMTDTDGKEFYQNANKAAGNPYLGYFNTAPSAMEGNIASALETLKKYYEFDESAEMFTNFPEITYLYNTSLGHKAIGEYIQSAFAFVGIPMTLENLEHGSFLEARKEGDFYLARNGWLADYNDPICFLEMWTTFSGSNDAQFGRAGHKDLKIYNLDLTDLEYKTKVENGTWAETYDVLIDTINKETNPEKRYALMHKAEDLLMSTGAVCPIYYYTDIYMINKEVEGFYSNPLGYKYMMHTNLVEVVEEASQEGEEAQNQGDESSEESAEDKDQG